MVFFCSFEPIDCLELFTQGKVKFGAYFGNKDGSWSEAVSLPSDSPSTREASSNDVDEGLSVPIAFVLSSGDIRGARWTITSRMCRGIKIVSVEQRFQMINNFGKPLVVHPVLVTPGKKVINHHSNLLSFSKCRTRLTTHTLFKAFSHIFMLSVFKVLLYLYHPIGWRKE